MDLTRHGIKGVEWIGLAHGTDKWQAVVITVMNILVPYNEERPG
jgi:hypothetical protein